MTNAEYDADFERRLAKIRAINERNLNARLSERPWHSYAMAAVGVVFTVVMILLFKAYL